MIVFDHVSKRYAGGAEALRDINFELPEGELAFLSGHSGSGKSTLLKLIALLERPTRGRVIVNNRNLDRLPERRIPEHRREIGMIFQDHRLLHDRNVFENVALPLQVDGLGAREAAKRVRAALDKVGLLKHERSLPITLSGGEQQRVGIARAIVRRPPLLLADEPTGNLDPALSREIFGLFEQFNSVGVTMIIATHDWGLIARLPYPIIKLREGEMYLD